MLLLLPLPSLSEDRADRVGSSQFPVHQRKIRRRPWLVAKDLARLEHVWEPAQDQFCRPLAQSEFQRKSQTSLSPSKGLWFGVPAPAGHGSGTAAIIWPERIQLTSVGEAPMTGRVHAAYVDAI